MHLQSTGHRWFPAQTDSDAESVSIWWRRNVLPDKSFYVLAVGVGTGDTVNPISTPEVNVMEPICVNVILGCVGCPPVYSVQVGW